MLSEKIIDYIIAIGVPAVISFIITPVIIAVAPKIGAMDVPKDSRRVHDHPIPRLGGLGIFIAFLVGVLLFVDIDYQIQGILIGTVIIVIIGVIDDIVSLPAMLKFVVQICAAVVVVLHGVKIDIVSIFFHNSDFLVLGVLAIPITVLWIVGVTNAVNLIDGLDYRIPIILACLVGACIGFLPYNFNPAKIFMGDTGALLLGFVLSTVSILGFFKFYAVISFFVPFLALGLPIADTAAAIIRRLLKGQSPMTPDRGHLHHRLIDSGLSQKQAVAVLYTLSALLGVTAVVITSSGKLRFVILVVAVIIAFMVDRLILKDGRSHNHNNDK